MADKITNGTLNIYVAPNGDTVRLTDAEGTELVANARKLYYEDLPPNSPVDVTITDKQGNELCTGQMRTITSVKSGTNMFDSTPEIKEAFRALREVELHPGMNNSYGTDSRTHLSLPMQGKALKDFCKKSQAMS